MISQQKISEELNINPLEDNIIINVDEKDRVFVERQFKYRTNRDEEIHSLSMPQGPIWLKLVVRIIRWYQNSLSQKLGNRCVFDPSCSHYSELAYREKGFILGTKKIINRLKRCTPNNGGIDELK